MLFITKTNDIWKKRLIELYSTQNEEKSVLVERWIRTMNERMWKYFSANSTRVYINVLDKLVVQYNNTRQPSIKMTPVQASKTEKENKVWRNIYPHHQKIITINAKISVGDKVKISKIKRLLRKDIHQMDWRDIYRFSSLTYIACHS